MSVPRNVKPGDALPSLQISLTAAHVVGGAIASRDWQPQHHDRDYAIKAKLPDIILNTPSQLGWFCRFATDWTGPHGRVGRTSLKMRRPVCPGDAVLFTGVVDWTCPDARSGQWIQLSLAMTRENETVSTAQLMIAVPSADGVEPWQVADADWQPPAFRSVEG